MSDSVQRQMAHGAGWMVLFKLSERSLGLVSTLVLVRVLSPADFGIVAMATSFAVMVELLTSFGFDSALIQSQDATEEHYHTAWTLNFLLGLSIALLTLALATPISRFYQHAEVFWVVCALAAGPLITGMENIGVVAFRKEMRFRREFAFQLSRKATAILVVLPLAFLLRSYWALVIGMLVGRLIGTTLSYFAHPFRPRFSLSKIRNLLDFSKWVLANNVFTFFRERSTDFLIGRLHGASALGVYSVSSELASMPTTELSAPINRALFAGFSRIAHDPQAMRAAYRNALGLLTVIAIPTAAGIFAVAPFLVPVVLGTKWLSAVPLIEVLSFYGALSLFQSSIGSALMAKGYPDRIAKATGFHVAMLPFFFAVLVPSYGAIGAAYAMVTSTLLVMPVYLFQATRRLGVPALAVFHMVARPSVAAMVMTVMVRWLMPDWSSSMRSIESGIWLVGGVMFGVTTYAIALLILWFGMGRPDGAEQELWKQLIERLPGARSALGSSVK